jgi:hypothetical protein
MFYRGSSENLESVTKIPMPGWRGQYWRNSITPQETDEKVLLDPRWDIACIIDGNEGKAYSRTDFLMLARPPA